MNPHRHRTVFILFFSCPVLMVSPLLADRDPAQSDSLVLGLREILRMAANRNSGTKLAVLQTEGRRASAHRSSGEFQPSLSSSTSLSHSQDLRDFGEGSTSGDVGLNLGYSLTRKSFADRRAARHGVETAEESQLQIVEDAALQGTRFFLDLLAARKTVEVETANLKVQRSQLARIEAFHTRGRVSISDVLVQRTLVSEAEARLLNAQYTLQIRRMETLDFINLPLKTKVRFDGGEVEALIFRLSESPYTAPDSVNPETLRGVRSQNAAVQQSEANLEASRLAYWPALDASGGLSAGKNLSGGSGLSGSDPSLNGRIGVSLSLPIFDKRQRSTSVRQAELNLESDKIRREDLKRKALFEYEQASLNFNTASQLNQVVRNRLASAEQSLNALNERYAVGAAALTEVSTANAQFLEARIALENAQFQIVESYLDVLHKSGSLPTLIENGETK